MDQLNWGTLLPALGFAALLALGFGYVFGLSSLDAFVVGTDAPGSEPPASTAAPAEPAPEPEAEPAPASAAEPESAPEPAPEPAPAAGSPPDTGPVESGVENREQISIAVSPPSAVRLQVGAYSESKRAEAVVEDLKVAGYPAAVIEGAPVDRVVAGLALDKPALASTVERMVSEGYNRDEELFVGHIDMYQPPLILWLTDQTASVTEAQRREVEQVFGAFQQSGEALAAVWQAAATADSKRAQTDLARLETVGQQLREMFASSSDTTGVMTGFMDDSDLVRGKELAGRLADLHRELAKASAQPGVDTLSASLDQTVTWLYDYRDWTGTIQPPST